MGTTTDDDGLLAVVAHSLLGSISVVIGAVETVRDHWDDLDEATRTHLLSRASVQAEHVSNSLKDLLRGQPEEVLDALDALDALRRSREDGADGRGGPVTGPRTTP